MPTLSVETVRVDGVSLVRLLVSADRPHRVRIEPRFEGPVWPPRTDGRIVDRWDETGVVLETDGGTAAAGFATPVDPASPAAEIAAAEPIDEGPPAAVATLIEGMRRRAAAAEEVSSAAGLEAAAEAVSAAGGLAAVERLAAEIDRDRRLADRLPFVPDRLRERLERVEIPAAAFARLADAEERR